MRQHFAMILSAFSGIPGKKSFPGILLILATVIALIWSNSSISHLYFDLWQTKLTFGIEGHEISKPLLSWINDGLLSMFFFVVGLEIKREIMGGELSTWKKASLPVFAAVGGMAVPAILYWAFNQNSSSLQGWGIPMATDIAFSLAILALLGKKVPLSLKIFLTALAIVDDLGAVLIIAIFYSSKIVYLNVLLGTAFLAIMILMNWFGVRNKWAYSIPGIFGIWLAFLLSGVHATVAGVLAAFAIPASKRINRIEFKDKLNALTDTAGDTNKNVPFLSREEERSVRDIKKACDEYEPPLQSLENTLKPWVILLILPVFALSNTGVLFDSHLLDVLTSETGLGILLGLVIGKPAGIFLFSFLACKARLASLPVNTSWNHILGIGLLGGIGFTMALFISELAFEDRVLISQAKISIFVASLVAGIAGYMVLKKTLT